MPLDGLTYKKPKIKPLQTGLAGLKQLGDALRCIPPYWEWNFADLGEDHDCGAHGCAIGLAKRLWPGQISMACTGAVARALCLPNNDLSPMFGTAGQPATEATYGHGNMRAVAPTDVADAIDRYIAGKEAA